MADIMVADIEKLLDEEVRPYLAQHGGNIKIIRLEENRLEVCMMGQCFNCPSAEQTMTNLVIDVIKEVFPQIQQVALVSGVSDSLMDEAREILRMRH